ncbi:MAG: hypothetical protein WAV93_07635 [Bacteroidales bacterium]
MKIMFSFLAAFSLAAYGNQGLTAASGKIERPENFQSENIAGCGVELQSLYITNSLLKVGLLIPTRATACFHQFVLQEFLPV